MLSLKIRLYYQIKGLIPRRLQIALRGKLARRKWEKGTKVWPSYDLSENLPGNWTGWPEQKQFALVLTHDVETAKGLDRCLKLADIEERLGFRSAFNFVALDYTVSREILEELTNRGFEVGVHGLYHNGSLYHSREGFVSQSRRINQVLRDWNAVGFRSPCMYHHLDWLHDLDIEYDASTFDIDPFEPQPDGMYTIFPFYVANGNKDRGYVELPYTLPQDFTLFVLMRNRTNDLWKQKLEWIVQNGGMALMVTHPDYMHFDGVMCPYSEYPADLYSEFLGHILSAHQGRYWHALPRDVARFWKQTYGNQNSQAKGK
jgi:hypothetical protein